MIIAIVGGAGKEGSGLALRWAAAGHRVLIGSRSAERAIEAADAISAKLGKPAAEGMENLAAAEAAEIVVLTVPYSAQQSTVREIATALEGKILIDVTVPLVPPKVSRVTLPPEGSAVEAVQKLLGPGVKVVSAFQNVSAHHLNDLEHPVACDVLVCGDDRAACETVIGLAENLGLKAYHAGVLANSIAAEALTSVLIALNQRYKVPAAGIRITGIGDGD